MRPAAARGLRFVGLLAVVVGLMVVFRPKPVDLPKHGEVPAWSFTERTGRAFGTSDLRGKIWVADFFFTNCFGPCPLMTARMKHLQERFAAADRFRLVSFTVDPERDTPEVLRAYAAKQGAHEERWLFLTGAREEINRLAFQGMGIGTEGESMHHSTRLVLVDPDGFIRGYYDAKDDEHMERLEKDLRSLLGLPAPSP
ncbi:MAG: SCO family protein [Planctomycetaceae bacterium]